MKESFLRLERIIGKDNISLLSNKTILVLGCGGVGGYVIESLVRSGIGKIIIVDFDKIDVTNINRQIIALNSTIGRLKVDVFEERIRDINPNCKVIKISTFINENNLSDLFNYKIDYFVDACDTINTKKAVIKECINRGVQLISSMGTGNKMDPTKLSIIEIRKTINDPIARILRKFVKDEKIKDKIMVLSSTEVPIKTKELGSNSFVPPAAGLIIASYVIKDFLKKEKNE